MLAVVTYTADTDLLEFKGLSGVDDVTVTSPEPNKVEAAKFLRMLPSRVRRLAKQGVRLTTICVTFTDLHMFRCSICFISKFSHRGLANRFRAT